MPCSEAKITVAHAYLHFVLSNSELQQLVTIQGVRELHPHKVTTIRLNKLAPLGTITSQNPTQSRTTVTQSLSGKCKVPVARQERRCVQIAETNAHRTRVIKAAHLSCRPRSIAECTMPDTMGLKPPPLSHTPQLAKRLMIQGGACSHPNRSPGPTILEKEPIEIKFP